MFQAVYSRIRDIKNGLKHCRRAAEIRKKSSGVYMNLALVNIWAGDLRSAAKALKTAEKNGKLFRRGATKAMRSKRVNKAQILTMNGDLNRARGKHSLAIRQYIFASKENPDEVKPIWKKGLSYKATKRPKTAMKYFNQALDLPLVAGPRSIWDVIDLSELEGESVSTAPHCFGCTAGRGSSCLGALG